MPGRTTDVTPLGLRRRLLVAESDLNRARLREEITALTEEVNTVVARARSVGSIASSVAFLVASVRALRSSPAGAGGGRASRFQALLKKAGILSSLWLALRARLRPTTRRPSSRAKASPPSAESYARPPRGDHVSPGEDLSPG